MEDPRAAPAPSPMVFGDLGAKPEPMQEPEAQGSLFREINKMRRGSDEDEEKAAELAERAKYNNTMFAEIAFSKKFEMLTLGFIVINAGFIGFDADYSARHDKPDDLYSPEMPVIFPIMENVFCVYFTAEVLIRFLAFNYKYQVFCDAWFVFDGTLVLFMVVETWILPLANASGPLSQFSILRLLRLARITRMAKLMRFFPELQIIVKGMLASVRSVGCTAFLLVVVLYVWAILFTSEYHQGKLADEDDLTDQQVFFGSMAKSMRSLFIMGTILDDITACTNVIRSSGNVVMLIAFLLFVLISSFTILNMLIGILCEVVGATGEGEREKNLQMRVRQAITQLFEKMDKDKNGVISRDEFMSMRRHKNVMAALKDLDIRQKHFDMYADLLFTPPEEGAPCPKFDWEQTINMIMRLRPGTTVSALDFASFQMAVYKNNENMRSHIGKIERVCTQLNALDKSSTLSTKATDESIHLHLPPPPPLSPQKAASAPGTAFESESGTTAPLSSFDHTPSQDIVAEIQRRLGMGASNFREDTSKPGNMEILGPAKAVEAFETLCMPQPDAEIEAWSRETYTC